jgi:hypothetical protein
MKIKELIKNVSSLVVSREIISHGTIRTLKTPRAAKEIADAEGIGVDEVGTDLIGDDDLAAELFDLAGDSDRIAELELSLTRWLEENYRGADILDYIDQDAEDELARLELLIEFASDLV